MSFQNPDDAYKAILKNELEYKNYNIFLKQSRKAPKTTFSKSILRILQKLQKKILKNIGRDQRMHREEKIQS